MSPTGGAGARILRGQANPGELHITCTCGKEYAIPATARDLAVCPNKRCKIAARDLPVS